MSNVINSLWVRFLRKSVWVPFLSILFTFIWFIFRHEFDGKIYIAFLFILTTMSRIFNPVNKFFGNQVWDEREKILVERSILAAALCIVLFAMFFVIYAQDSLTWRSPKRSDWYGLFQIIITLVFAVPTLYIGWNIKPSQDEDLS